MPRVFQPVDKTVEISVQGTYAGQLAENKFYVKGTSAITEAMVAALASLVDSWVHTTLRPLLAGAWVYTRTVARDLTTEASFESVNSTHTGEAGTGVGEPLPGNATIAVHRDTGLSGKKAKSRIYWIGLIDGNLESPDVIHSATATLFISALDTLRANILADTTNVWTYGYVQRILDHVKLATGNFIEVFHHSVTDRNVDSQRRRLAGRGR